MDKKWRKKHPQRESNNVDAYLAYMLEFAHYHPQETEEVEPFNDWVSRLAYALIFNEYRAGDGHRREVRGEEQQASDDENDEGEDDELVDDVHMLESISEHPFYSGRGSTNSRVRCRICHANTAMYCTKCSHSLTA